MQDSQRFIIIHLNFRGPVDPLVESAVGCSRPSSESGPQVQT